jgi:type III restriction enzyme
MLTEGWDCNTVTHIVGLRPFMSQLLCEQVVGRGLRRSSYEVGENGRLKEEVAKVFGVPFEVVPFKQNSTGARTPPEKRHHVYAVPQKAEFEIRFPRVEGYRQAIRNRVTVNWDSLATLLLDPLNIPPEVEMKHGFVNNRGRYSIAGPGKLERVDLNPYRRDRRFQELVFEMARDLTRDYKNQPTCEAPPHVLFPQLVRIVERFLKTKVHPLPPAEIAVRSGLYSQAELSYDARSRGAEVENTSIPFTVEMLRHITEAIQLRLEDPLAFVCPTGVHSWKPMVGNFLQRVRIERDLPTARRHVPGG